MEEEPDMAVVVKVAGGEVAVQAAGRQAAEPITVGGWCAGEPGG